jgi:hypothetical protein
MPSALSFETEPHLLAPRGIEFARATIGCSFGSDGARFLEQYGGFGEPLIGPVDCAMLEVDFAAQVVAGSAAERSALCEVAFRGLEFSLSGVTCLRQRALLLLEEAALHSLLGREVCAFDLRPCLVPRARGQRALVDGESLDRGFFECSAEAGERVAVVEVVEVAFVFTRVAGDVEPCFRAGPRERDVAPLLQARVAGSEDEGPFDCEPWAACPVSA